MGSQPQNRRASKKTAGAAAGQTWQRGGEGADGSSAKEVHLPPFCLWRHVAARWFARPQGFPFGLMTLQRCSSPLGQFLEHWPRFQSEQNLLAAVGVSPASSEARARLGWWAGASGGAVVQAPSRLSKTSSISCPKVAFVGLDFSTQTRLSASSLARRVSKATAGGNDNAKACARLWYFRQTSSGTGT